MPVYSGEMQKGSFFNDDTRDVRTHTHTRAGTHASTRTHATNKINNTKQAF